MTLCGNMFDTWCGKDVGGRILRGPQNFVVVVVVVVVLVALFRNREMHSDVLAVISKS